MAEHDPLVSIIALNYNQSGFLVESLDSFAGQSYRNFEIIITDDCSTDDSREKIDKWIGQHPELNIHKIYNPSNYGLCRTLNLAVRASRGEFIKPIACDDTLHENYLEEVMKVFLGSPDISLLCTDMQLMNETSDIKHTSNWKYGSVNINDNNINDFEAYLYGPFLNTPSLIYRKELFEKIGGYDEELAFEDWDFLLRAKKAARFSFIDRSLVNYRIHASNMHRNIGRKIKYSKDIIRLLRKHFGTSESADKKIRGKICDELCDMLLIEERTAVTEWAEIYTEIKAPESGQKPLVSVLTTVYNAGEYIANAIESVLLQTYPNVELIIVTDPCTDNTIDIIKSYVSKHPNIILHENKERLGIIASFNIGLGYCKGEYIARMDLDDLIHPQRFERQIDILQNDMDIDVVSSWMKIFDEHYNTRNVEYRSDPDVNKITMLFYSPFSHAASMFKASVLKKIQYIEDYKYAEDYDLWFRILTASYRVQVIPEYLYLYRTHSEQVTNEKNIAVTKDSLRKISTNILDRIGVSYSPEELEFHLEYVVLHKSLPTADSFLKYDQWLNRILKANARSLFFDEEKLKNFVFINYWQSYYLKFRKELKGQLIKVLNSPFNLYGIKQKSKDFIKQFANR